MKRKTLTMLVAPALVWGLYGCENTAQGVKEDAQPVLERTAEATGDAATAVAMTPMVKAAIIGDAELNDAKNLINVETVDGVVHLTGTVASEALKERAETVAKKAISDNNSTAKLSNDLRVEAKGVGSTDSGDAMDRSSNPGDR